MNLLEIKDLKKHFPIKKGIFSRTAGYIYAVDGVSFFLKKGETFGLVGESGCGKSTIGKILVRLIEPTFGSALFNGKNIFDLSGKALKELRREMQIIFQDPYSSLNPRMTVGDIIGEPLVIHNIFRGNDLKNKIGELLDFVGLSSKYINRYPHEFSGGQRQRIAIARALSLEPSLIIADEPVSALDVSIQAQIINLLEDLQKKLDLTYLFISHDLSVVKHISSRIGVMYLGKIMELSGADELYDNPLHPYTQALLSSIPVPDPDKKSEDKRIILEGDVPSPEKPPPGCPFNTRCWLVEDICREVMPELLDMGNEHYVACHVVSRILVRFIEKIPKNSAKKVLQKES